MNPELNNEEPIKIVNEKHKVFTVTKTSKYLSLILFMLLPFLGGYIGYTYAPDKILETDRIVEVEKIVIKEVQVPPVDVKPGVLPDNPRFVTVGETLYFIDLDCFSLNDCDAGYKLYEITNLKASDFLPAKIDFTKFPVKGLIGGTSDGGSIIKIDNEIETLPSFIQL